MSHHRIYEINKKPLNFDDRLMSTAFSESEETDYYQGFAQYFYDEGVNYEEDVSKFVGNLLGLKADSLIKQTVINEDDNSEHTCYGFIVTDELIKTLERMVSKVYEEIRAILLGVIGSHWLTMSEIRNLTHVSEDRFWLSESTGPGALYDIVFLHHYLLQNKGETMWINGIVGFHD